MSPSKFAGIHAILYAFFDRDNRLDRAAMRRQVEAVVGNGAHGVAVLGLATEVNKLSPQERRQLVDWTAEDVAGRMPLAVTVAGDTVGAQKALAHYAVAHGADWLVLQPPSQRGESESFYLEFFAAVMADSPVPVGIQNAPEYLGFGLGPEALLRLARQCPQFRVLKGEGPAVVIGQTIGDVGGSLSVFNGRGGLELVDNLRAGCAGMIVAPDCFDHQVRIYEHFLRGEIDRAEALYRDVLPAIVFVMQSLHTLICYGKRIAAWRMGVQEVFDREPALQPTAFGLAAARRFAERLGPLQSSRARRAC
jgi:2-keto-3-deoxy-L-arabinonate dehydratase